MQRVDVGVSSSVCAGGIREGGIRLECVSEGVGAVERAVGGEHEQEG